MISAKAAKVEACFAEHAITRADAVAALTAGQRARLFPAVCECGKDHSRFAKNLVRVSKALGPVVRQQATVIDAPLRVLIAVAAVYGDTAADTDHRQLLALATEMFGGAPPEESVDTAERERQCSRCNTTHPPTHRFCAACGTRLLTDEAAAAAA